MISNKSIPLLILLAIPAMTLAQTGPPLSIEPNAGGKKQAAVHVYVQPLSERNPPMYRFHLSGAGTPGMHISAHLEMRGPDGDELFVPMDVTTQAIPNQPDSLIWRMSAATDQATASRCSIHLYIQDAGIAFDGGDRYVVPLGRWLPHADAATRPTTGDSTRPVLQSVSYRAQIYLLGLARRVTISPSGVLTSATRPHIRAPLEAATRQLTPREMTELARLFEGWNTLRSHYVGVADGGSYAIRYGHKSVSTGGGPDMPEQFAKIRRKIEQLAGTPRKDPPTSRPASKPLHATE
jgi:hypothetical protein